MGGDEIIEYRVDQLENAVATLAAGVTDMREFMVSIRAWLKALAVVWSIIAAVTITLISAYIWQLIAGG